MAGGPSFIAVKCYLCSTMQVKQKKKSSNKWCCVICNEKQSIRQIFAQSFLAKDVRGFVQKSNTARQQRETNPFSLWNGFQEGTSNMFVENGLHEDPTIAGTPSEWTKPVDEKRRNDWSEYLVVEEDADDTTKHGLKGSSFLAFPGSMLEAEFVTELPKKILKPKRKFSSPFYGSQERSEENTLPSSSCKRGRIPTGQHDGNGPKSAKGFCKQKILSKWDQYLENEDSHEDASGRLPSSIGLCSHDDTIEFQTLFDDQKVDEDIHPDFM